MKRLSVRKLFINKIFLILLVFAVCHVFISAGPVFSKEKIHWYEYVWEPASMPNGYGQTNMINKLIIEEMPEYEHVMERTSFARILESVQKGENAFNGGWIYFPKEMRSFFWNSMPIAVFPYHDIYARPEVAKKMGEGPLSFEKLLKDDAFVYGNSNGRTIGMFLDPVQAKYQDNKKIYIREGKDGNALLDMLVKGRIDYLVEYRFVMHHFLKKNNYPQDILVRIPIAEHVAQGGYGTAAVLGPKTEWGMKVMKDINKAIVRLRDDSHFITMTLRNEPIQENWPEMFKQYNKLVRNAPIE